uniref:mitochondrial Rho GTPase 1-A-like isoform X3 n=1 Tax=Myxine glutinosa TaxID=7769 RepID=UPI00358FA278
MTTDLKDRPPHLSKWEPVQHVEQQSPLASLCKFSFLIDNKGTKLFSNEAKPWNRDWLRLRVIGGEDQVSGPRNIIRMRKDVRILLVGERHVGKTSIIMTLVNEEFPSEVPACAEEVTIPAEVTLEKVPTHIVDYSEVEQTEETLKEELNLANAICLICAVNDEQSFEKVSTKWIPLINHKMNEDERVPIILVANKSDVLDHSNMDTILPLMNQFPNIEVCIECSAKTMKNISEVFHYAQKAVLHPISPLYSIKDKELKPKCAEVLARIFKISDIDNDGILNDQEMDSFQQLCFNTPLLPKTVREVKKIVKQNTTSGISKKGFTLQGFIYLHTSIVQRGRHETMWTVLRTFGYDDDLELNEALVDSGLKIPLGCTTELSQSADLFLHRIFNKHDQDKDNALNPVELQDLFSVFPCPPWDPEFQSMVHTTDDNCWITWQGFIAHWTLTAYLEPKRFLKHLLFLGYPLLMEQELSTAIIVTKDKKIDLQKGQSQRNVFLCRVVGSRGAGKSSFLQTFLGHNNAKPLHSDHHSIYAINTVQVYGQDKYLLLHESAQPNPADVPCDVACLLYDVNDAQSFRHCANVHKILKHDGVRCLVVACKSDLPELRQDYWSSPAKFCRDNGLPPPVPFSCVCVEAPAQDVFVKLATLAAHPSPHRYSMGFRSGVIAGHFGTVQRFVLNHSWVLFEVCLGSLSCCKTHDLRRRPSFLTLG